MWYYTHLWHVASLSAGPPAHLTPPQLHQLRYSLPSLLASEQQEGTGPAHPRLDRTFQLLHRLNEAHELIQFIALVVLLSNPGYNLVDEKCLVQLRNVFGSKATQDLLAWED